MSALPTAPTAAQVREALRTDAKRTAGLSEQAMHTLSSRGRLHPDVIKAYNKGRKPEKRYALGNSRQAVTARKAQREALVKAGVAVGKRGPLPKAFLASLKG
jgi:hypothetical protein